MTLAITSTEDLVADLIHDVRQPLTIIGYSVSFLDMLLAEAEEPVRAQLRLIAQQVDTAARLLEEAAGHRKSASAQCAAAGHSLDLT